MKEWCILRTAGSRTAPLAKALNQRNVEAWTPTITRPSRRDPERTYTIAVMPTFVFADSRRSIELLELATRSIVGLPPFNVMRWNSKIPTIADAELATLREEEARMRGSRRQRPRDRFKNGQPVRVDKGSARGLIGVVEDVTGDYVLVSFPGREMKIASWLLIETELFGGPKLARGSIAA